MTSYDPNLRAIDLPHREICGACGRKGHGARCCPWSYDCEPEQEQINWASWQNEETTKWGDQTNECWNNYGNTPPLATSDYSDFSWGNYDQTSYNAYNGYNTYNSCNTYDAYAPSDHSSQYVSQTLEDTLAAFIQNSDQQIERMEAMMKAYDQEFEEEVMLEDSKLKQPTAGQEAELLPGNSKTAQQRANANSADLLQSEANSELIFRTSDAQLSESGDTELLPESELLLPKIESEPLKSEGNTELLSGNSKIAQQQFKEHSAELLLSEREEAELLLSESSDVQLSEKPETEQQLIEEVEGELLCEQKSEHLESKIAQQAQQLNEIAYIPNLEEVAKSKTTELFLPLSFHWEHENTSIFSVNSTYMKEYSGSFDFISSSYFLPEDEYYLIEFDNTFLCNTHFQAKSEELEVLGHGAKDVLENSKNHGKHGPDNFPFDTG